jgi:hypothetical protein
LSWEMRFLYNVHCIVHVLISTVIIGTEYKVLVGYNTYLLSTYVPMYYNSSTIIPGNPLN